MAENDAAKEGGEEIQVGNRSKVPFILGAVAVLIIGIGLGWAVSLLTAASDPAADDPAAAEKSDDGEQGTQEVGTAMTNLGNFTVNLRDSAGGRVLQMEIQVESDKESVVKVIYSNFFKVIVFATYSNTFLRVNYSRMLGF